MGVTNRVAEFVAEARLADFSAEAVSRARLCVLDTIGVAVAGARTRAARAAHRFAGRVFATGPAALLGSAERYCAEGAGLANGVAASALDLDDGHRTPVATGDPDVVGYCAGHPGAVVVPAALAAAEETGASGEAFLAAVLVGYEVGIRAAAARRPATVLENATGNWGGYAAAAAVARIRPLSPAAVVEAFGLAASFQPNPQARATFRTMPMVKESIGWAVVSGQAAAAMAADGFTGLEDVFDDARAFGPAVFEDLGRRDLILGGYFKPHAACRNVHSAIDATLSLVRAHAVRPDEVTGITVRTSRKATMMYNPAPTSLESAQYSVPFCVALALHAGAVAPDVLDERALTDPAVLATASRVRVEVDPAQAAAERGFPRRNRAAVEVTARGRTFATTVDDPWGDAANPLSPEDLAAKFRRLVRASWSPNRAEAVLAAIARVETIDVRDLSRLLPPDVPTGAPAGLA
jgi:2-methylcitrate dehydratase PrpD